MLITFSSDESADIIMFGDMAKKLLTIIGKDGDDRQGIVTVEQLPQAIASLNEAIETDRLRQRQMQDIADNDANENGTPTGVNAPVGLSQRAWPLLDMLERAKRAGIPVIWKS